MAGVTIRSIEWHGDMLRPVPMPSTLCPIVKDWETKQVISRMMGVMHCNACVYAVELHVLYKERSGEVHCGLES